MLRILHAADLHLDSPFAGLSPEQAAQRRSLQRQLPDRIVDLCHQHRCDLLLISGDVFDGERVCPETVEALQRAFGRCQAKIFISPGNHDPYRDDSPWVTHLWPEQVHIFAGPAEAVALPKLGCRVWGGGFTDAACFEPLPQVPDSNDLEIGVFHGDPLHSGSYRSMTMEQLRNSGLDYLALGHIHRTQLPQKAGKTWYGWPGIAMGRGFDECGVCGVFRVELDHHGCKTTFLPLEGPRYERITVPAGQVPALPEDSENVICRLTFTGEADDLDLDWLHRQLSPRFLSLELRDETVPRQSLWAACGDGTLRGLALDVLKTRFDAGDETAALAAQYVLAALEGREQP